MATHQHSSSDPVSIEIIVERVPMHGVRRRVVEVLLDMLRTPRPPSDRTGAELGLRPLDAARRSGGGSGP